MYTHKNWDSFTQAQNSNKFEPRANLVIKKWVEVTQEIKSKVEI